MYDEEKNKLEDKVVEYLNHKEIDGKSFTAKKEDIVNNDSEYLVVFCFDYPIDDDIADKNFTKEHVDPILKKLNDDIDSDLREISGNLWSHSKVEHDETGNHYFKINFFLNKEFIKCIQERDGFLAGWQRERADYMNFKKEMEQKFESLKDLVGEETLLAFLPIVDSFYLALGSAPKEISDSQWFSGIKAMEKQINDVLKKADIEYIEALGKPFDPEEHQALEMVENKDEAKSNLVAEELQKGYRLKGKVIRPSLVKVYKSKEAAE